MSSRVRKQTDCPVGKQGPMRATLPVSSVMKASGGLKKNASNSPTLSPTNVWRRISPDHALSGQRSPGAVNYKGKARFGASVIRRTASLDTLYHKGQWPRDYYFQAGQLQVDKSTQTDDGGGSGRSSRGSEDDKLDRFLRSRLQRPHKPCASGDYSTHSMSPGFCKARFGASVIRRTASLDTLYHKGQWPRDYYFQAGQLQVDKSTQTDDGGGSGRSSRGSEDDKLDRFLRSRLQRPHKPCASGDYSTHSMSPGFWSRFGSGNMPLRAARSSVEGLNQEIERLVLYPASGTQTPHIDRLRDKVTPEGHRAPLAELLRRSVNTQTPHDLHTAHSSGGSVCSSPDLDGSKLGTSPQINRFLAREPPDGCEKVCLKAGEGTYTETLPVLKPAPPPGFTLRPSLGSAFQPLQPAAPAPAPGPAPAPAPQPPRH